VTNTGAPAGTVALGRDLHPLIGPQGARRMIAPARQLAAPDPESVAEQDAGHVDRPEAEQFEDRHDPVAAPSAAPR
jgi:hypothetical protein